MPCTTGDGVCMTDTECAAGMTCQAGCKGDVYSPTDRYEPVWPIHIINAYYTHIIS